MLPDEDVYKPKRKKLNQSKGLEKFMSTGEEEEIDSIVMRGEDSCLQSLQILTLVQETTI